MFINCPFDKDYLPIFDAILFCVNRCWFILRCALENENTNVIRLHNIIGLIKESKYAVHDLSRVTLDAYGNLPRFNMPLELGIFIGAQAFGDKKQREKEYLVLESQQFRFKQFISDISGQDNQPQLLAQNKWEVNELTFLDCSSLVAYWVQNHLP